MTADVRCASCAWAGMIGTASVEDVMAVSKAARTRQMPVDLIAAIESGHLTQEQLRQLITFEAEELGLSFAEAVDRARRDALPKNALGTDLWMLADMLDP